MLPPSLMPTPTPVKKSSESEGNGNSSHYDATTVEQIKAQFQAQIEAMMLSQVRNWLQAFLGRSCASCFTVGIGFQGVPLKS